MSIKKEMDIITKAMQADSDLAWTWHCNIAMAAQDEGVSHVVANKLANRFMQSVFKVDTKDPLAKPPKKVRVPKPKKSTTHITNVLIAELKKIRKSGFNGVRFHECHMGMDPKTRIKDFVSDGLTEAQAEENLANYCTIIINPDFEGDEGYPEDTEYRETIDNSYKFYQDFEKHLRTLIGEDITITDPKPSCEFEITRRGYKCPHS